jgi:hypothetical protein
MFRDVCNAVLDANSIAWDVDIISIIDRKDAGELELSVLREMGHRHNLWHTWLFGNKFDTYMTDPTPQRRADLIYDLRGRQQLRRVSIPAALEIQKEKDEKRRKS